MQNMDRHASSPAPYGRACVSCAQSKCKCIIRRTGGPCERCRRLNKECRPIETVRRRNPKKPPVSKTARIEEKLDGLVSLLKSGAQSRLVNASPLGTAAVDDSTPYGIVRINANAPTHIAEKGSVSSSSSDYFCNSAVLTPPNTDSAGSSYHLQSTAFLDAGEPSPVEAEEYLVNFQTYKLKYFPFIYIPSTTSARQLRQEQPFLWLCIMTVGSKSISQQQMLSSKIRQTIAQEMVVQSTMNIDLLLGLLVFIGWANYQVQSKPFLAVFTQLAVSLVFELGLNKPVPKATQVVPCMNEKRLGPFTPRTMEQRRAVLGCFLVTSIISSFLQKIDALHWTPHMDECLQMLDERNECLNDEILVQQVRLQLIVEKMAAGTLHAGARESSEHTREFPRLYLEELDSQLQDIKTKLLADPQTDETVFLHLYSTILETALSPTFIHTNQVTFPLQKSLIVGLESIKSWFDVFFTITPAAYIGFPFSIFSQLVRCVRCLTMLYPLTTLSEQSWNENEFCKTVNPLLILDRVITNLEQVPILAELDNSASPGRDPFSRGAQLFRSLRPGLEAKLGLDDLTTISLPQNSVENFPSDTLAVEFFDNDWLMDLLLYPNTELTT